MTTWIRCIEWWLQLPSKPITLKGDKLITTVMKDSHIAKSSPLNDSPRIGVAFSWVRSQLEAKRIVKRNG
jgi:hypothetical protein